MNSYYLQKILILILKLNSAMRNLCLGMFSCCFLTISTQEVGYELLKELLHFPLRENPFFAKVVSLYVSFSAVGIEDGESDPNGYVCQSLGKMIMSHHALELGS